MVLDWRWGRALSAMTAAQLAAALDVLAADAVRAWLAANPDADLPDALLDRILARGSAEVLQLAATRRLTAAQLDRLATDRRVGVALAVVDRGDLTRDHLEALCATDHVHVLEAVFSHRACDDELRGRILAGTTLNPRARNQDRLIALPRLDVPERLLPAALASLSPTVLLSVPSQLLDDDARRCAYARQTIVAALAHSDRARKSPLRNLELTPAVRRGGEALSGSADPRLVFAGRQVVAAAGRRLLRAEEYRDLLALVDGAVDVAVPPHDATAAARIVSGEITNDELAKLHRVDGVDFDRLDTDMLVRISRHAPAVLPVEMWARLLGDPDLLARLGPAPRAALDHMVAVGMTISASAQRATGPTGTVLTRATVEQVAGLVVPASAAVGRGFEAVSQLGAHVAGVLGDDPARWELFATLIDDYAGTLRDLLDTVVSLTAADSDAA